MQAYIVYSGLRTALRPTIIKTYFGKYLGYLKIVDMSTKINNT